MKLSIVIVNYNVRYFLEQCLQSVEKALKHVSGEVFVVDNHSVDDSVEMVRTLFPWVNLIVNKENTGFSRANNQAIRQANGEYILMLNPDTLIKEDTLVKCVEFMDTHPEAGALGVRMIDGSGRFLPESKRGLPSPFVAFCKATGLYRLFPRSRRFNWYYQGHIDEHEVHETEVLAGAFMFIRKKALDEVGLLDESFFMYGEDIDLSYRLLKAGYANYFFPETTIIHYKGESTKKGTLNYVRIFYKAMLIFSKKHFSGQQAKLFNAVINAAIYLRAAITLGKNMLSRLYVPILDAGLIFGGAVILKDFWARHYHNNPDYYEPTYLWFNLPVYTLIWIVSIYFTGGYDSRKNIGGLAKGILWGTLILAAIYAFLPETYRASRALILISAVWALLSTLGLRFLLNFIHEGRLNIESSRPRNLAIVGGLDEGQRVLRLMRQTGVNHNFIGFISPEKTREREHYLSNLSDLPDLVRVYNIEELIFCLKDISSASIIHWMTELGPEMQYKMVPEASLGIIGSPSKNARGELYTVAIRFNIQQPRLRRNKRLFDLFMSLLLLLASPVLVWFQSSPARYFHNLTEVLLGKKSLVGYCNSEETIRDLPALKPGVLHPVIHTDTQLTDDHSIRRINLFYAKDYQLERDIGVVLRGLKYLGQ